MESAITGRFDTVAREMAESASGAVGPLAAQLDIPDGLAPAVEAALGRWMHAVAFEDVDAVRDRTDLVRLVQQYVARLGLRLAEIVPPSDATSKTSVCRE